jgi:hypothetical protein
MDSVVDLRLRTLDFSTSSDASFENKCEPGSRSGTLGIDGNSDGVAAICPQWLARWDSENNISELAGHFAHEYMHILGFGHFNWRRGQDWREKTFVYQVGNIVADLISSNAIAIPGGQ